MGFFGDLFTGSDASIEVESFLTPEQQLAFKDMLAQAQQGQSATPWEFTGGWPTFSEEAPGPNKAQQLSLAGMEKIAAGESTGMGGGIFDEGREAISSILGRDPTDFDDYFRKNIEDPLMEALNRPGSGGLSTLKKGQVGSGNLFGGAYQAGLQDLLQDTYDTMARERAGTALAYRDQDTQHQLAAMGLIPEIGGGGEANILSQLMMAGEIPRQAEMAQWQARLDDFTRQVEEAWRRKMYASGLASTQTTATAGVPGRPGMLDSFFTNLGGSAGAQLGDVAVGGLGGFLGG